MARRYFEILNRASRRDRRHRGARRGVPQSACGRARHRGIPKVVAGLRAAFPDLHFTLEDEFGEGNKVATRWVMRGTQGTRKMDVSGMDIFLIADGKIKEIWVNMDTLAQARQMGQGAGPMMTMRSLRSVFWRRSLWLCAVARAARAAGRRSRTRARDFRRARRDPDDRGRRHRRAPHRCCARPADPQGFSERRRPGPRSRREDAESGRARFRGRNPRARARSADGAHRRRARAARGLVDRSLDVPRARRMVLRPRHQRQQGRRRDARCQLHSIEARRDGSRLATSSSLLTGDEETSQSGSQVDARRASRAASMQISRSTPTAAACGSRDGRPCRLRSAGEREDLRRLSARSDRRGRPQLARQARQPDLHACRRRSTRIGEHQFPLHVERCCAMFLERRRAPRDGQTAIDMRAVAAVPPDQAAAARLSRAPSLQCAASHDVRCDAVDAGHANNALPQLARAVVNCRILPGSARRGRRTVLRQLAGDKVKVTVLEPPVVEPAVAGYTGVAERARIAGRAALAGVFR